MLPCVFAGILTALCIMSELFTCGDPVKWRRWLDLYWDVVEAKEKGKKAGKLLNLDKWYQEELPTLISSRADKHINQSELVKLMEWKLTRGKFRPRLQQLVASNSDDSVQKCSRQAFSVLPDVQAAITELSLLKGVGPATASAVLAAGAPEQTAFMSDEAMEGVPGLKPIQYTAKHYALYLKHMMERTENLNKVDPQKGWTPHKLEMCLWAMTINSKQKLELLKDVEQEKTFNDETEKPAKRLRTR
ncbi:uncharacterized protein LOC114481989 isoform X2 [Gouania willdenowi]|nr:uncharacterized protein LOC114481989 isoform X2 [Gouania willdenowi]